MTYTGILPDLFEENQGMVGTGTLEDGVFKATEILAKHDEDYMPKEVVDALKEQGVYQSRTVVKPGINPPAALSAPIFPHWKMAAGMQSVSEIAKEIVAREGGFVNDPDDPGGATKYGVTIHTMRRLGSGPDRATGGQCARCAAV